MDFDLANDIYQRGIQQNVCVHVYTLDTVYAYRLNHDERNFLDGRMEVQEIDWEDLRVLKGKPIIKLLYENLDYSYLRSIHSQMMDIEPQLDISYSFNRYLEFNTKGVTKGSGLQTLCDHLSTDIQDVIAIGDNWNDASMLEVAGLGVGVSNTIADLKPKLQHITKADHNHDAIAEVIETFIK